MIRIVFRNCFMTVVKNAQIIYKIAKFVNGIRLKIGESKGINNKSNILGKLNY